MKARDLRFCPHCGRRLIKSKVDGYAWECKHCDEDFYDIECRTIAWVMDLCEQDLRDNKKKVYVDHLIDLQGHFGIVFESLEEMFYRGKYKYPNAYKYRKELSQWVKEYVNEQSKNWKGVKY